MVTADRHQVFTVHNFSVSSRKFTVFQMAVFLDKAYLWQCLFVYLVRKFPTFVYHSHSELRTNRNTYFHYSGVHKAEPENCCHSLLGRLIPHPRSTASLSVHSLDLKWNLESKQTQMEKSQVTGPETKLKRHTIVTLNASVTSGLSRSRESRIP